MSKYSPYSFSKIDSYSSCPRKFKYSYIEKIKVDKEQAHLLKGKYIHNILERYRNPDIDSIEPESLDIPLESKEAYKELTASFIGSQTGQEYVNGDCIGREIKLSFNSKLEMCDYWDEQCLFRGSIDRLNKIDDETLLAIDWKTGKYDPKRLTKNQLKYYALWCFMQYPEIKHVKCHYVYIETCDVKEYVYSKESMKEIMKELLLRIKNIEKARMFVKNRTALCNYCDFYKHGHCTG